VKSRVGHVVHKELRIGDVSARVSGAYDNPRMVPAHRPGYACVEVFCISGDVPADAAEGAISGAEHNWPDTW